MNTWETRYTIQQEFWKLQRSKVSYQENQNRYWRDLDSLQKRRKDFITAFTPQLVECKSFKLKEYDKYRKISFYGVSIFTSLSNKVLVEEMGWIWVADLKTYVISRDVSNLLKIQRYVGNSKQVKYSWYQRKYIYANADKFILFEGTWWEKDSCTEEGIPIHHIKEVKHTNGFSPEYRGFINENNLRTFYPKRGEIYLGIEYEYAHLHSAKIEKTYDNALMKIVGDQTKDIGSYMSEKYNASVVHDGSLPTGGLETRTQPAILSVTLQQVDTLVKDLYTRYGMRADKKAGMHIHVGRTAFTPTQIAFIHAFVNHKANRNMVVFIAGRKSTYARFNDELDTIPKNISKKFIGGSKYQALNVSKPHTIEFRIFASSNDKDVIKARIQWVHAICSYAKETDLNRKLISDTDAFMKYITKDKYPELFKYFKQPTYKKLLAKII